MPSNNSKYTKEIREKTARYILENKKSATSVAEEMGIDTNTVCRWVRDYRRKYNFLNKEDENNKEYFGVICDAIEDVFLFLHWKQPKWWMDTERQ